MPGRIHTKLLNQTIYGNDFRFEDGVGSSLSVRLEGLARGVYAEIDSIEWGVTEAAMDNVAPGNNFMFGVLQILRNERFDPNFLYGTQGANQLKDVIFQDVITPIETFAYRRFRNPMRLDNAADYLIVMPPPRHPNAGNAPYDCALTVTGRMCSELAPMGMM